MTPITGLREAFLKQIDESRQVKILQILTFFF